MSKGSTWFPKIVFELRTRLLALSMSIFDTPVHLSVCLRWPTLGEFHGLSSYKAPTYFDPPLTLVGRNTYVRGYGPRGERTKHRPHLILSNSLRYACVSASPLATSRRTQNMRESAMGRSKRKRSSRVSSGGGSMRASHGLGPLQEVSKTLSTRSTSCQGTAGGSNEGQYLVCAFRKWRGIPAIARREEIALQHNT